MKKEISIIVILLVIAWVGQVLAQTFEQRKQVYFQEVHSGHYHWQRNAIWGLLEDFEPDEGYTYHNAFGEEFTVKASDMIHMMIRAMVSGDRYVGFPGWSEEEHDATVGFFWSVQIDNALAMRLVLQYQDKISPEDYDFILNKYHKHFVEDSGFLISTNPNQKIMSMVGVYLYTEYFEPDATVMYWRNESMGAYWDDFSYQGRSYVVGGGPYNLNQFAKDWLQHRFDKWVNTPNGGYIDYWEFDSMSYNHAFLCALPILYDFAKDPVIKRKAKMAMDLLLLDYFLDYSADHHGGAEGRVTHSYLVWRRPTRSVGEHIFFGFGPIERMRITFPSRDTYVSSYRVPSVIEDAVIIEDEPDDYYQIHMEYNPALHQENKGKFTYLNKYYNLGGGFPNKGWQLNIKPSQDRGIPFKLIISEPGLNFEDLEHWPGGSEFYQYKNALFCTAGEEIYIFHGNENFDRDETISGWRFLKKGKVCIAVTTNSLEVIVEGVEYPSYEAFKTAVIGNAEVTGSFRTSKGDVIRANSDGGTVNGVPIWNFPFERMETVDNQGNKIVDWNSNVMTISKHGMVNVYDFNSWEYSEEGNPPPPDTIPPNPPTNLISSNRTQASITLTWTAPSQASDGDFASYFIIKRDGTQVGTSVPTTFVDDGLLESTTYHYAVYSVDDAGNVSPSAATGSFTTLGDTMAPTISSVMAVSETQVDVVFSEPVEQSSAENTGNYAINPDITINSATLASVLKTVHLSTSSHTEGVIYTITINNIRDRASTPNIIASNSTATYTFHQALIVSNLSPSSYQTAYLGVGDTYYIDRDYLISSIPQDFEGLLWIKTANDDKASTGDVFLTFDINQNAMVYVAYDATISTLPDWLSSWLDLGVSIITTDTQLNLYSQEFAPGTVTLGGNYGGYHDSMYVVLIRSLAGVDTTPPAPPLGVRVR